MAEHPCSLVGAGLGAMFEMCRPVRDREATATENPVQQVPLPCPSQNRHVDWREAWRKCERPRDMLTWLTKRLRVRTAVIAAVVYGLCVVAPPLALAFTDGAVAAHCLTEQHGIAGSHNHDGSIHVHADGTTHRHHDSGAAHEHSDGDGKSPAGNCCGLFCMNALAAAAVMLTTPAHFIFAAPTIDDHLVGRGPDRINRPPIA
jgi:hypothetical protein